MAKDKKNKNLELLKNAVDSNRQGNGAPRGGGGAPGSGGGGGGNQIMYRGKPVGRSGSSGAPGSGGAPGSSGAGRQSAPAGGGQDEGGDVKEALRKLTQLFNDGLITTAEYDAKRAEILNRL